MAILHVLGSIPNGAGTMVQLVFFPRDRNNDLPDNTSNAVHQVSHGAARKLSGMSNQSARALG